MDPYDAIAQPFPTIQDSLKSTCSHLSWRTHTIVLEFLTAVIRTGKYGESNASALEDLTLQAGNPVKEYQGLRIKKAQDQTKTKTSATLIFKIFLKRYQDYQDKDCQGRLLASFQDDAKYEHVDQDTRSQDGKDDKDIQGKDLKISELKSKSVEKAQNQRSHSMKEQAYNKDNDPDQDQDYKSLMSMQSQRLMLNLNDSLWGRLLATKY
ncbi:hypothetical protein Tco_0286694 [Tanacetum coccineum]